MLEHYSTIRSQSECISESFCALEKLKTTHSHQVTIYSLKLFLLKLPEAWSWTGWHPKIPSNRNDFDIVGEIAQTKTTIQIDKHQLFTKL